MCFSLLGESQFINYLNLHRAGDSERCCLLGAHVDFTPGTSLPSVCLRSTDRLRWTLYEMRKLHQRHCTTTVTLTVTAPSV